MKDSYSKAEQDALQRGDLWRLDTLRFYRHAGEIYACFSEWKDEDRFYFIPLKIDMNYYIGGVSLSMADGVVYLGTFIRCSLEHPDLFTGTCPKCGKTFYTHAYSGSPLSGTVSLSGGCPCGWRGAVRTQGWLARHKALVSTQQEDSARLQEVMKHCPEFKVGSVDELLTFLGQVPSEPC